MRHRRPVPPSGSFVASRTFFHTDRDRAPLFYQHTSMNPPWHPSDSTDPTEATLNTDPTDAMLSAEPKLATLAKHPKQNSDTAEPIPTTESRLPVDASDR